jgi:hypothetical protein
LWSRCYRLNPWPMDPAGIFSANLRTAPAVDRSGRRTMTAGEINAMSGRAALSRRADRAGVPK